MRHLIYTSTGWTSQSGETMANVTSRRVIVAAGASVVLAATGCGGGTTTTESAVRSAQPTVVVSAVPTASEPADTTPTSATVTPPTPNEAAPTDAPVDVVEEPVFTFTSSTSSDGWSVINDTVMGGVSTGEVEVADGALAFTGELSLDNNGGFASVRSQLIATPLAAEWAERAGPRIEVDGDGRTWTVEVRTDDIDGGWIAEMPTSANKITDVTLPWASFTPVTRFLDPRDTDAPLDPRRVVSIAFYLVDGVEAPFRLAIRSIS